MNTPLDEVRRLCQALAERDRELAELRDLVQAHLEATQGNDGTALERERAAYERGRNEPRTYEEGFTLAHDVALGADEPFRPFVAGVREGFDAGYAGWQKTAAEVFGHLHIVPSKRLSRPGREIEKEAG